MSIRRLANLIGFVICVLLMAYAYYSQFHGGLQPCVLCIFQRIAMIVLGIIFLIAFLHHPKAVGARVYGILLIIVAAAGGAVSIRQSYLQHLPLWRQPPCGPGLNFMFKELPLNKFIVKAFTGTGDCALITWKFAGLTMPEWVLIWFIILGVGGLIVNLRWAKSRGA